MATQMDIRPQDAIAWSFTGRMAYHGRVLEIVGDYARVRVDQMDAEGDDQMIIAVPLDRIVEVLPCIR